MYARLTSSDSNVWLIGVDEVPNNVQAYRSLKPVRVREGKILDSVHWTSLLVDARWHCHARRKATRLPKSLFSAEKMVGVARIGLATPATSPRLGHKIRCAAIGYKEVARFV